MKAVLHIKTQIFNFYTENFEPTGFLRQGSYIFLVKMLNPISSLALSVCIGRYLGVRALGQYSITGNLFMIFNVISVMGLDIFVMKEISRHKSYGKQYLRGTCVLGSIASLLSTLMMLTAAKILGYSQGLWLQVLILSFSLFPTVIFQLHESAFIAYQKQQYFFYVFFFGTLLRVVLSVWFAFKGFFLAWIMAATTFSSVIVAVGSVYFMNKKVFNLDPAVRGRKPLTSVFKSMPYFSLISIILVIFSKSDVLVLSRLKGEVETGIYSVASKFIYFGSIVCLSLTTAMYPRLAMHYKKSSDVFKEAYCRYLGIVCAVIFSMIFFLWFFSKYVISAFFGRSFLGALVPINILAWALLPIGLAQYFYYLLLLRNKQKAVFFISVINLPINILSIIYFVYLWGSLGAAYGVLLSYCILAGSYIVYFHAGTESKKEFKYANC